jgi:glucuronoarabinoxylan endo-1,4-beta-xylanase
MPRDFRVFISRIVKSVAIYVVAAVLLGACAISPRAAEAPQPAPAPGAAPQPAPMAVVGTVEAKHLEQTLLGFGAAIAYYQNWSTKNPYHKEIYQTLFKGLNLSILRLRNTYSDPTNNLADVAQDALVAKEGSEALGRPLQIMLCSWSPPVALKSNHATNNGGTLIKVNGAYAYDQFAQYWADSLAAYAKDGVKPTYVTIQNEPDFKATWDSCLLTPNEGDIRNDTVCAGYSQALDAVFHKFQSMPDPPKLIGPETIGIGYGDPENYIPPTNQAVLSELWGLSHHLYHGGSESNPDSFNSRFNALRSEYGDKPRLMTEFDRGDMFETAWLINNCMTEENASAYVYWSAIWPGGQAFIYIEDPDRQANWKNPHGWRLGDHYWAMKHFSYFTGPGYHRVDTSTSNPAVKMSAYLSPNGKRLCVVILNTSDTQAASFTLALNGYSSRKSAVYRTAGTERFQDLGALPKTRQIDLPPHSIVTVSLG